MEFNLISGKVWDGKSINLFILVSCSGKFFMKIKVPNNYMYATWLHDRSIVRRSCQSVMNYESLHWREFHWKDTFFLRLTGAGRWCKNVHLLSERTTKISLVYLWIATLNRFHWKDAFFLRLSGSCRWCKNKFTFANGQPREISVYNGCSESMQANGYIACSLYTVYTTLIVDFVCSFSSPKP